MKAVWKWSLMNIFGKVYKHIFSHKTIGNFKNKIWSTKAENITIQLRISGKIISKAEQMHIYFQMIEFYKFSFATKHDSITWVLFVSNTVRVLTSSFVLITMSRQIADKWKDNKPHKWSLIWLVCLVFALQTIALLFHDS